MHASQFVRCAFDRSILVNAAFVFLKELIPCSFDILSSKTTRPEGRLINKGENHDN